MAEWVGKQLGNYRLLRLVGEGAFAEVYLGEHVYLQTQAAIKVLQVELAHEETAHFLAEARTIARLIHPHIIRLLECGVQEEIPFLVMEYAPGGTLRQRHPKGTTLAPTALLPYVHAVAEALSYAHRRRLVHRDVKPENLLLGRSGSVLLGDFGVATLAHRSGSAEAEEIAGTVAYMAPEQLEGLARPESDQYALGIVLYEWLTGAPPFRGSFSEVVGKHALVEPPPLCTQVPTLPAAVERVVLKALAKDPKKRFEDMQAFYQAFAQACGVEPEPLRESIRLRELPPNASPVVPEAPSTAAPSTPVGVVSAGAAAAQQVQAAPVRAGETALRGSLTEAELPERARPLVYPPVPRASRPEDVLAFRHGLSRRRVALGLAGVALAGYGIAAVLSAHLKGRLSGTPASTPAPLGPPFYVYRGHSMRIDAVAWSPTGQRIVSGDESGSVQVWDALSGGHVLTHSNDAGSNGPASVAWSPNGQWIVSGGGLINSVQVWDAMTGRVRFTFSSAEIASLAWSPNGQYLAAGDWNGQWYLWDANTGGTFHTYQGHKGKVSALSWAPDSTHFVSGAFDGLVKVWNAATGGTVLTYRGHIKGQQQTFVAAAAWSPDGTRIASSDGGGVQVWDATTGDTVLTYRGQLDSSGALAWSPSGQRIASVGGFGVEVWDATTGADVLIYQGAPVMLALAWSPNGHYLAAGGVGATVQVWQAG